MNKKLAQLKSVSCTGESQRSLERSRPEQTQRNAGNVRPSRANNVSKHDIPSLLPRPSTAVLEAVRIVTLKTASGELRIRLKPEWHEPSVRFVREAALSDSCTVKCELYRAEPGFLLQGAMRAVVSPNKQCREFPGGPADAMHGWSFTNGEALPRLRPPLLPRHTEWKHVQA